MRRVLSAAAAWLMLGALAFAQPVPPGTKVVLGAQNAVAIINATQDTIVTVQIQGTFVGTVSFLASLDGSIYTATSCTPVNSTTTTTTATTAGIWSCPMVAVNFLETQMSAYTSGTAIVSFQTGYQSGGGGSGGGGGGNVSIVQGGNTAGVNGSSQLSVNCANCSGSGVSQVDNTGFTPGTTNFVPVGGEVDDVGTSAVAENSAGATRITGQRGLHVNLRTNAGAETGIAAAPLQVSLANTAANGTAVVVNGSGVTQPVSGTVTANMGTVTADPFGANADAASATGSISAKLRFISSTGIPITGNVTAVQATGTNLHIVCDSGCSSSTAPADEAAFTPGTTPQSPAGGFFQTTATNNALTNLQMGAIQLTAQRAIFSNLRNASGTEIGTSSTPVQVSVANTGANGTKILVTPDSVALPANQSVNVAQINGVTTLMGNGVTGTGAQRVTIASDNTTFTTAPVATATTTDGVITTNCYITSAASTNSTNCKGSAGNVYFIHVTNTTTTNYFLRIYNASSAPTCSSATGFVETIPALGGSTNGGVNGRVNVIPQSFATGIGFCLTGGGSSTDNTNAATGVYVTIGYK